MVVVANGAPRDAYDALRERFPAVEWVHVEQALGFSAAIGMGLERAAHPWSYLMNNDVTLAPDALAEVLEQRAPDVFAVGVADLPAQRIRAPRGDRLRGLVRSAGGHAGVPCGAAR